MQLVIAKQHMHTSRLHRTMLQEITQGYCFTQHFEFEFADRIVIEFDCIARRTMQTDMVDNRINCIECIPR